MEVWEQLGMRPRWQKGWGHWLSSKGDTVDVVHVARAPGERPKR